MRLALTQRDQHPHEESLIAQAAPFGQVLVQLGEPQRDLLVDVLIQHQREHREHCVDRCIADHQETLVERHRRQIENRRENRLHGGDDEAAVDDELRELRGSLVGATTVNQQKLRDELELRNAEVAGERSLPAFESFDADSGVGLLYHADIISAVANCAGSLSRVLLNQPNDLGLLCWAAAAADDRRTTRRQLHELVLIILKADLERLARHDQRAVLLSPEVVQLEMCVGSRLHALQDVQALIAADQMGTLRDASRRFELVARQHPNAHAGVSDHLERRPNLVLQPILDAGQTQKLHLALQRLNDGRHTLDAISDTHPSCAVLRLEVVVLLDGERLLGDHQRAESFARHVATLLVQPVVVLHDRGHDDVGAFEIERDFSSHRVLHDDSHALAFAGEREDLQDLELQKLFLRQRANAHVGDGRGDRRIVAERLDDASQLKSD